MNKIAIIEKGVGRQNVVMGRQNAVLGTFAVALTVWDYSYLGL